MASAGLASGAGDAAAPAPDADGAARMSCGTKTSLKEPLRASLLFFALALSAMLLD